MEKRMLIAGILCTMMLALAGAKGKVNLSDAGTTAITGTGFKNFYSKEGCEYSMIGYEHRISRDSGVLIL